MGLVKCLIFHNLHKARKRKIKVKIKIFNGSISIMLAAPYLTSSGHTVIRERNLSNSKSTRFHHDDEVPVTSDGTALRIFPLLGGNFASIAIKLFYVSKQLSVLNGEYLPSTLSASMMRIPIQHLSTPVCLLP